MAHGQSVILRRGRQRLPARGDNGAADYNNIGTVIP